MKQQTPSIRPPIDADPQILENQSIETEDPMIEYVCKPCGSSDVKFEAYVHWDVAKQMHVLDDVLTRNRFCMQCHSGHVVKIPMRKTG